MYGTLQTVNAARIPEGTRDGKCAQYVQPTGVFAERKTVFVVDSSTGCLRMTSEVLPLVKYLSNLQTFAVTFGLHQKKQISTSFTIDTAIARIQGVYDFDCQCIDQVKAFLGTEAQTQGPQGTVSSVVVEDERRILLALGEIRDLFRKYAPQLLDVFKLKSLLTLVVENFFSEMRAGASDMPMQLQFDFRFSRAMKEHLKQMCTTRFSYYTSATSHYPRVKSDLKYSALPKMSPPSTAQLTKQQVQQMRDWRMKYGQSVPQKTVRNMSTKDNPGTLPINLYAQVQPTITPLDFSKIAEDGQDGARTTAHHDNSHELLYTSGDVVFLASDATSGRTVVYVLEESITASTKKAKARLFEGDPFNPLIFYTEGVVEINVKDIGGSLEETVRGDGNIELTENEFIRYQSRMIECVDAVTIEEAREISEGLDTDQDRAEDARPRRASRARKRPHTDDFLYYDD